MSLRDDIATTMNRLHNYSDDALKTADAILALPQIKEMMEKAEKWDNQQGLLSDLLAEIRKDLDLMLSGLEVEQQCQDCNGEGGGFIGDVDAWNCDVCHGMGKITRPAKPEEVRDMIEWFISPKNEDLLYWRQGDDFKLKSGRILRMKNA